MTQKRKVRTNPLEVNPLAAAPAPAPAAEEGPTAPGTTLADKAPLFWRIFGAAAVAAVAVVGVAVYQHVQSQISAQRRDLTTLNNDLRKELAQLGGNYGQMVKKEEHTSRVRTVWDTLKELRADRSDLTTMKERCALLTEAYKAGEEDRRALAAEVRRLRESKTGADERDALVHEIRSLRERIAQIESKPTTKSLSAEHVAEQEEP